MLTGYFIMYITIYYTCSACFIHSGCFKNICLHMKLRQRSPFKINGAVLSNDKSHISYHKLAAKTLTYLELKTTLQN